MLWPEDTLNIQVTSVDEKPDHAVYILMRYHDHTGEELYRTTYGEKNNSSTRNKSIFDCQWSEKGRSRKRNEAQSIQFAGTCT